MFSLSFSIQTFSSVIYLTNNSIFAFLSIYYSRMWIKSTDIKTVYVHPPYFPADHDSTPNRSPGYSIRWPLYADNTRPARSQRKISVRLEGRGKGTNQHLRYLINIPWRPQFHWNARGTGEGGEFVFRPQLAAFLHRIFLAKVKRAHELKIFIRFQREIRSVADNRGYPLARGCKIN